MQVQPLMIATCYGCVAVLIGALCMGLAEAVEYLAETAYYARLTYELAAEQKNPKPSETSAVRPPTLADELLRDALR
jgi:hypothetical protein